MSNYFPGKLRKLTWNFRIIRLTVHAHTERQLFRPDAIGSFGFVVQFDYAFTPSIHQDFFVF